MMHNAVLSYILEKNDLVLFFLQNSVRRQPILIKSGVQRHEGTCCKNIHCQSRLKPVTETHCTNVLGDHWI